MNHPHILYPSPTGTQLSQTATAATTGGRKDQRNKQSKQQHLRGRPVHHIHSLFLKALRIHKSVINYLIIINTSYLLLSHSFLHPGHACCLETQREIYRTLKTSRVGRRRIRRSYRGIPLSQLQDLAHTVNFCHKGGTSPPNNSNKNHFQPKFKYPNKLDISVNKRAGEPQIPPASRFSKLFEKNPRLLNTSRYFNLS